MSEGVYKARVQRYNEEDGGDGCVSIMESLWLLQTFSRYKDDGASEGAASADETIRVLRYTRMS